MPMNLALTKDSKKKKKRQWREKERGRKGKAVGRKAQGVRKAKAIKGKKNCLFLFTGLS